jgi:hypothetical protein
MVFLAFLGVFGSIGAFRLQARVLEVPALDPVEGSSEDSVPGSWAEIGMAGIGMSPSNPGIGEMKISRSCIQEIMIRDPREIMKAKISRAPYRIPFNPNVVRAHLLVSRPCGDMLEHFS